MTPALIPPGVPIRKRLLDLVLAIPALIVISPLLGVIGLALLFTQGWPVLFTQSRGGYQGSVFKLHKFRTMSDKRDARGHLLPDQERLTRIGQVLRSLSLDELPSIFNIFKGEMSWVGPRPLFARYLERYSPEQARRHAVLPGLTGWAQVNGRNAITWDEKFAYDLWYVDHWSLGLDMKILFLTFWKVLKREGISPPGQTTMEEFKQ